MNEIVEICFNGNKWGTPNRILNQYDRDQKILVSDLMISDSTIVNFSRVGYYKESISVTANSNTASIPNEYLVSGGFIYIWFFLEDIGDNPGHKFEYRSIITVLPRARPSGVEPTEEQKDYIDILLSDIERAKSIVETDKDLVSSDVVKTTNALEMILNILTSEDLVILP